MHRSRTVLVAEPSIVVPAHLNFGKYLIDQWKSTGDRYLINGITGEKQSLQQLAINIARCAVGLNKIRLGHGIRVAMVSENREEMVISALGAICCGALVGFINPTYSSDQFQNALNILKPEVILCSSKSYERYHKEISSNKSIHTQIIFDQTTNFVEQNIKFLEQIIAEDVDLDLFEPKNVQGQTDGAIVLFSSGTSGLPKGVVLTHLNLLASVATVSGPMMSRKGVITMLTVSSWSHTMGIMALLGYLCAHRNMIYIQGYNEDLFYKKIQDYKADALTIPAAIIIQMSKSKLLDNYDLSSVKTIVSGSSALTYDVIARLRKRMNNINIVQGYGMTEATLAISRDSDFNPLRQPKLGSVGCLTMGSKLKIVDENGKCLSVNERGELRFKGPNVMKGYLDNPVATENAFDEEGYLKTGDIGYYDKDGYIFIVDRIKELIKYKGHQVPPAEIEAILLEHPGVAECGVVGTPDEAAGELPTALVVRQPGTNVTAQQLVDFVAKKINAETGESVTYRDLAQQIVNCSYGLGQLGVKKGDVIGLMCENRTEFMICVFAALCSGAVFTTLNPAYATGELQHVLNISKPKYVIASSIGLDTNYDTFRLSKISKIIQIGADGQYVDVVAYNTVVSQHINIDSFEVVDVKGQEDVAGIMYSSGTTGLPKGVIYTHLNPFITPLSFNSDDLNARGIKRMLTIVPWVHAYGLFYNLSYLAVGRTIVYLSKFNRKQYFETIEKFKIVDLETEKSLGPNEKGGIRIKGLLLSPRYIGPNVPSDAYDKDGFFRTGDIGYYDDEKYLFVVDRIKELIKYKGNHVAPAEIESAIDQHPGVIENAVIGVPDIQGVSGELPTAFVVKEQGAGITEKDIIDLVARKLSPSKHLHGGVRFINMLPRSANGKVLRRLLKEKYATKSKL